MHVTDYDCLILGGGLAGLTAALQISREHPSLRLAVLERQQFPVAEAAHKVGESSVEIGAHYFAQQLDLAAHIEQEQLPKLGLRYFFGSDSPADLTSRCEMGGNDFLPSRSYQLDRGRLENHLAELLSERGVPLLAGSKVRHLAVGGGNDAHQVTYSRGGEEHQLTSRWLFDASGRAGLLKRTLHLQADSPHKAHAVWFRINARLRVDDECADKAWRARHAHAGQRWLSTVHFMGRGYWVWLIPLASGATSVGIVVDAGLHDYQQLKNFALAREWLSTHEPLVARMVAEHADQLMDFAGYQRYSYDCKQLFGERWALLGEAGFFLDPFYSPGSDFIAMGNTMAIDLMARDMAGEQGLTTRTAFMNQIFKSLFANHLQLYHQQYPLFANAKVMATKVVWDFAYYWAIPATLFFHRQLTNTTLYARCRDDLAIAAELGSEVQTLLRRWYEADSEPHTTGYVDVPTMPLMQELNAGLLDTLSNAEAIARLRQHCRLLQQVAGALRDYLQQEYPQVVVSDLPRLQDCPAGPLGLLAPLWQGLGLPARHPAALTS